MRHLSYLIIILFAISLNAYGDIPIPTVKEPLHPKLGGTLLKLVETNTSQGKIAAQQFADLHLIKYADEQVLVELTLFDDYLTADIDMSLFSRLNVNIAVQSEHFIEVWVAIDQLVSLAESMDIVSRIHRPHRPINSVTSQGVGLISADDFHNEGFTGEGAKIAVLDGGFRDYQDDVDNGELPENMTLRNFTNEDMAEGSQHGTACAEIVYDLVPDADLYLIKSSGGATFENAIEYLINEEVDVISYSRGYVGAFNDYFEGNDPICSKVSEAADVGILFATSAGNQAKAHYRAQFDDDNENDNYHRFADGVFVNHFGSNANNFENISRNELIWVTLQWDDFPESGEDYNLYILFWEDDEWVIVESSDNVQNGNDLPTEDVGFLAQTSGRYGFAVQNHDGEDGIDFTVFTSHDLAYRTLASSVTIPAVGRDAFTVGAVNRGQWNRDNPQLESFSSRGPTNDNRIKPDIAGPDGTASFVYNGDFFGTSSACPHVAGAAALVLSVDHGMDNLDLWDYLIRNARDVGDNRQDNLFGHGLLRLDVDIEPVPHIVVDRREIEAEIAGSYEIVVSNEGAVDLIWQTMIMYMDGDNWITLNPSNDTLEAGDSQILRAVFDDSDLEGGEYVADIHILSNDRREGDIAINVIFNTGGHAPEIVVWPEEFDFDEVNQGESQSEELLLLNIGDRDLIISEITIDGDYFSCDFMDEISIEPDGETTFQVTFAPESGGDFAGVLTIISNDPEFGEFEVPLTGIGINLPPFVANPIEDVIVDEDSDWILVDLDEVFEDPEGGDLLYFSLAMEGFEGHIDEQNVLRLRPEPNFNGESLLIIVASDDHEQRVEYEFGITVRPVNDAPEAFNLLAPENEDEPLEDKKWAVTYEWAAANDVDGDNISYDLFLHLTEFEAGGNLDTTIVRENIQDTVHIDSLLIELGIPGGQGVAPLLGIVLQIEWWVEASDGELRSESNQHWQIFTAIPGFVSSDEGDLPTTFKLDSPYPNPFNGTTGISYSLPINSHVSLQIYDLSGQTVATLIDGQQTAGHHQIRWNAKTVSSGVYLVRMEASNYHSVEKVVLVK